MRYPLGLIFALLVCLSSAGSLFAQEPSADEVLPFTLPRNLEAVGGWDFAEGTDGWLPQHACRLDAADGFLLVEATGADPYFHRPIEGLPVEGRLRIDIRMSSLGTGLGEVFWTSTNQPEWSPHRREGFKITHDGQMHDYAVEISCDGRLTNLRIDPGGDAGSCRIDSVRVVRLIEHPLELKNWRTEAGELRFDVENRVERPVEFSLSGQSHRLEAAAGKTVAQSLKNDSPIERVDVVLQTAGLPDFHRTLFIPGNVSTADWLELPLGDCQLRVSPDGLAGQAVRDGKVVARFGPWVRRDEGLPSLKLNQKTDRSLRFQGEGIELSLQTDGPELTVRIESDRSCEGPVVRPAGPLEHGLFAGLEYLSRGERSSSTLDLVTAEHLRYEPDPMNVTMPLMTIRTPEATVAMTWRDMQLQPTFAVPDFIDCTADGRMSLKGKSIETVVRIDEEPLEETVLWAVRKLGGLPPLPEPPRTAEEQYKLCVEALDGPLRNENGWGHCVEDHWARHPSADIASTYWRLTGKKAELPGLTPGGSHVRNEAFYFVTGRAGLWLERKKGEIAGIIARQQSDGSFRYNGEYRKGHFEDTASGLCAQPTWQLLEYAWMTGDEQALAAGRKGLDFMRRFQVPRGAQTWECALHTPDQLASAYAVWAFVRGYELTGNEAYLREARRWALTGIPFTYLWTNQPVMLYGTPPVLGSTNWRAPCWIGLPVQWVGGVYAYALTRLAPYDQTLDWNHLARGILIAAEQMQYTEGPYKGTLPDSFALREQERRPWNINPCAIVSLRMALDGHLDSLSVASGEGHRVVSPFPVEVREGQAIVTAPEGENYQVLIDGHRIVEVRSQGEDRIPLK